MRGPTVPPGDDVTTPWWDSTREHRLLLQQCESCGHEQHPPRALCTRCGRLDALGWRTASGSGTVDTFTVVHRAPAPVFPPPYVVARIRLAEGPVLLSNVVDVDPAEVGIGDEVRLSWRDLDDGRALPVFVPVQKE